MVTEKLIEVLEKAQGQFGYNFGELSAVMHEYIIALPIEDMEELGYSYLGNYVPVSQNINWYKNPQIKEEFIKRIIEACFEEVFWNEYNAYLDGGELSATTVTTEKFDVPPPTKVSPVWAGKDRAELEQLTNEQLYQAIEALDQLPAKIDAYLKEQFIDEYLANSIEEAVQQVEKFVLVNELERLLGSEQENTEPAVQQVEQTIHLAVDTWAQWYSLYGKELYQAAVETDKLEAPSKISWYAGLNLEVDDCYQLKGVEALQIDTSTVIICNGIYGENFVGLAKLERVQRTEDGKPMYVITWKNDEITVDMSTLTNERFSLLVVAENNRPALQQAVVNLASFNEAVYRVQFDLSYEALCPIATPLCIDFGTTNTTLGCYLEKDYVPNMPQNAIALGHVHYDGYVDKDEKYDGVNFIHFYGPVENQSALASRKSYTVPTVVYVETIDHETGEIVYRYGYEALEAVQQVKNLLFNEDDRRLGSLIYGLKRWIYALDEEEELVDQFGNKKRVARQDILKGYIDYVLARATHQVKGKFTTLHFSTPVKMKGDFIQAFTKMFPEYEVKSAEESVDEGIAVLYDAISQEIASNKESFKGRALIFDCGGGTTDLANCEYEVEQDMFGDTALAIKTKFENGNPNFGGNNLTYRIMQMLKIKLAVLYRGANVSGSDEVKKRATVEHYLKEKEEAIATINEASKGADESAIEQLYAQLEKTYREEEAYIPTAFKRYEHLTSKHVKKVRHNFYFLWDMAEAIKREFFSQLNKVTIDLNKDLDVQVGHFILYTKQDEEELQPMNHAPQQFAFTIREIEQLIVPEIYAVEHQFLDQFNVNEFMEKDVTSLIKLTGQSCRIPYFRDMLKEFIPGKYIRQSKKGIDSEKQALELKLACVRGVIHYWRDEAKGVVGAVKGQHDPIVPYDVLIDEPAKVMSDSLALMTEQLLLKKGHAIGQQVGFATIPKTATTITLTVRNERKQIGEDRKVALHQPGKVMATAELEKELIALGFTSYIDALNIAGFRKRTLIFVSTANGTWGVKLQMATFNDDEGQWEVSEHSEPFEDAHAYENFFDGKH